MSFLQTAATLKDGREGLDEAGHGSCVVSRIAGATYGIAKQSNIVIVKVAIVNNELPSSEVLNGLIMIYDDIIAKGLKGKAVVNLSLGGKSVANYLLDNKLIYQTLDDEFRNIITNQLGQIIRKFVSSDIVVVTASGSARVCLAA